MDYFADNGAHVLVDGQFGSTGKGVLAAWLAKRAWEREILFSGVISNAGPNSGHTFYHGDDKHVLKQLPTFAVALSLMDDHKIYGSVPKVFLSAGAIIDPAILALEASRYPFLDIYVHANAAVITDEDKTAERQGSVAEVAGTRSGTGQALANKILRQPNAVWGDFGADRYSMPRNVRTVQHLQISPNDQRYFVEVSQGFSLGINSQFYPKVTSRECTVAQAIADARIAPKFVQRTYMVARTFPIRVGNVDGHSSGAWYPDQREISWDEIGVKPELTTVTQRERRIATFSAIQLTEAILANQPDFLLMNFRNYMSTSENMALDRVLGKIRLETGVQFEVLNGFGPKSEDVVPF